MTPLGAPAPTRPRQWGISRMKRRLLLAGLMSSCALAAVPASAEIETVTVTATRVDATIAKRDAPNVVDVQSMEQIRSLPDVNAAEALERIPGVSLETDSGEG